MGFSRLSRLEEGHAEMIVQRGNFWRFGDRILHKTKRLFLLPHLKAYPPQCIQK